VISGGAYGIDGAAQWRALEAGGASFAVLGCGVDVCYPAGHRVLYDRLAFNGGVLSEYAPGTPPRSYHFPLRNRLISALSDVVAVVEARRKSGSLITADYAMEQSRPVLAVPGRPEDELSQGCNELINQGAEMILSVDSFIRSVFSGNEGNNQNLFKELALAPDEKLVYSSLDLQSKSIWELAEHTVLPLAQLSESLLSLEQKGLIRETEHGRYARV
jgi:DNA processing protein